MVAMERAERISEDVARVRGLLNMLTSLVNSTLGSTADREGAVTGLDDFLSGPDSNDLAFLLMDGVNAVVRIGADADTLYDELRELRRSAGPSPTGSAA